MIIKCLALYLACKVFNLEHWEPAQALGIQHLSSFIGSYVLGGYLVSPQSLSVPLCTSLVQLSEPKSVLILANI